MKPLTLLLLIFCLNGFGQTKNTANCETELLGFARSYVELTKRALSLNVIDDDDLKAILTLENPTNPLATKAKTTETVALNIGFKKILADSQVSAQWAEIKRHLTILLDQIEMDLLKTKVAHKETEHVLSPVSIDTLRYENASLPVLTWGEDRQLQIAYFFPDDLTLKTSQSLITIKRGSSVGLHMLTDEDTRERGRISRGQIEWSKEGELEGAFVRRDQKIFFKNFSTGVQSPYFGIGDSSRIDDSGHFETSKLSDGSRFALFHTQGETRLLFTGEKQIVFPGTLVAPLYRAGNGEHYFAVKDFDQKIELFAINKFGELRKLEPLQYESRGYYPMTAGSFFMDSKMNLYFALNDQSQCRFFRPLNGGAEIFIDQNQQGLEGFGLGDWIEYKGKIYFRTLTNFDQNEERTLHVVDVSQGTLIKSSKHKNVKTVSPWFRLSTDGEPGLLLLRSDSALPIGIDGIPSGPRLKMNTLKESFESKIYYDPDGLPYLVIGNVGTAKIFSLLQKIGK